MGMARLYIAYGSNLNIQQMERRCPSAKVSAVGKLQDYRLVFKALGKFAYATIESCQGEFVPVTVWQISERDERSLDRYEGYPTHYNKEELPVKVGDQTLQGMVYIMNEVAVYQTPEPAYYQVVRDGYRSFGFDEGILLEAYFYTAGGDDHNILRKYRKIRGLSQTQLSSQSGVSIRSIQCYEGGRRKLANAKAQTVQKLAGALKIPIEKLLK